MEPEQLPGKCQIKQAKQEDLMKVDIQQFGMTLFFLWGGYQLSNDYQHLAVTTMQWSEMSAIQNKALTKKVLQAQLVIREKTNCHLSVQYDTIREIVKVPFYTLKQIWSTAEVILENYEIPR